MKTIIPLIFVTCFAGISLGTSAQVIKLANNNNIEYGVPLGTIGILVNNNDSLWRTNGTPAGTVQYASNVSLDPDVIVAKLGSKIFFSGITTAAGKELWATDGTAGGTVMVKDINPGVAGSNPGDMVVYNNIIYFFATTPAAGIELWKSDGTTAGTVQVADINPGAAGSGNGDPSFFVNNNILYFIADNGTAGAELWKTDGTAGGTVLVKDINAGTATSFASGFTALGTQVIFSATDASSGAEVWKTDGTTAGTVLVKDIFAFPGIGSSPSQFMLFNNKVYFTAFDFSAGFELWATDGTNAGTTLIKDIDPGSDSGTPLLFNAVFIGTKFYFSATTVAEGTELWVSDGTTVGTTLLKNINPGAASSDPLIMLDYLGAQSLEGARSRLYNGKIFFEANTAANGNELWVTDGTAAGTLLVKDIRTGTDSALNGSFAYQYYTGGLYFAANDGTTGTELWKSDASNAATVRVADIHPTGSSFPEFKMLLNDKVLFTANDGDNGQNFTDLMQIDGVPLPLTLLSFNAGSTGKHVDLQWTTTHEIRTASFDIEKSVTGLNFEKIGSVQATAGIGANIHRYQYRDMDALQGPGKLYYRLKQIDSDGRYTVSKIAFIDMGNDKYSQVVLYPNPARDQIMLSLKMQSEEKALVMIYDELGRQVFQQALIIAAGSSVQAIPVSRLGKGIYTLKIAGNNADINLQFVKQ